MNTKLFRNKSIEQIPTWLPNDLLGRQGRASRRVAYALLQCGAVSGFLACSPAISFSPTLIGSANVVVGAGGQSGSSAVSLAAASGLGWVQSSPTSTLAATASWTVSPSTGLSRQKIQFFADGVCSAAAGSELDLSSASTQTQNFVGVSGMTYTYQISSLDASGNPVVSACSSPLAINGFSLGNGSDGMKAASAASTVINTYAYITDAVNAAGSATLNVNSTTGFAVGDQVLVIQMQNTSNPLTAGLHEFATILAVGASSLSFASGLHFGYVSGTFNQAAAKAAQVVRVPQYTDLTVNSGASIVAQAWNGYTGGVIAFRASGTVNVAGSINADGAGFRGGFHGISGNANYAYQGESVNGMGLQSIAANQGAGGGGYSNTSATGGGGASYLTSGGLSYSVYNGWQYSGEYGLTLGTANLYQLLPGSGGGGASGDRWGAGISGNGGAGGGIIFALANAFSITGTVSAQGATGGAAQGGTNAHTGGGGGGSGGSIYLNSNNLSALDSTKLLAAGGAGGSGSPITGQAVTVYAPGGSGGQGMVRLDFPKSGSLTVVGTNQVLNDYAYITDAAVAAGAMSLDVNDGSIFNVGDQVLVIQMQDFAGGTAGQNELAQIQAVNGNTLALVASLAHHYASGTSNVSNATSAQVVRVPQYNSLTVPAGASVVPNTWNGYTGGIVAINASGAIVVSGAIQATGAGFRGGAYGNGFATSQNVSQAGESTHGLGAYWYTANLGGGGGARCGSAGNSNTIAGGGGGGGAYGTSGSSGTMGTGNDPAELAGIGGSTLGASDLSVMLLGSGGGGGANALWMADVGGAGGAGGGLVYLNSSSIQVTGTLAANGGAGANHNASSLGAAIGAGAGGGGSGGAIRMESSQDLAAGVGLVTALGGAGGSPGATGSYGGNGGVGGVGRVFLTASGILSGLSSPVSH